ncbi:hypothetical protein EV44_g3941 [Erysiphe necator]|uniref:DDE-1 domain-containing protein n=1 Tax=Uncinula necator TaxID=52586 RepID=A0A0B1PE99_UNCNE|nr:hypothetical protein EV44_g3941 [Erysiphe necator]
MGVIATFKVAISSGTIGRAIAVQSGNLEWATAVEGKVQQSDWYRELPVDWEIAVSDNGWTTNQLGFEWIKHFNTQTESSKKGAYRLLILDGHSSHATPESDQYCQLIPLDTTHKLLLTGFVSNYRPPLPRTSLPPKSSDQEANVASDLDLQSRDTTKRLWKVQLPQNQLTRNTQNQELERGTNASVNKELSPKMEKENYKDKFNNLKLDELPEDQTRYNTHLDSELPYGLVIQLTNIRKLYIDKDAKYIGEKYDILDNKLAIFRENCRKVGLKKAQYHNAFLSMLKGDALDY